MSSEYIAYSFANSIVESATKSLWHLSYRMDWNKEIMEGVNREEHSEYMFTPNLYQQGVLEESLQDLISEALRIKELVAGRPVAKDN